MLNKLQNEWRTTIIFMLLAAMLVSLFLSRALLSIAIIGFVLVCFIHNNPRKHFLNFISSPILWSMSLLFLLPLLSGIWSENKMQWYTAVRVKLPLLLLPIAFAAPFEFSKKLWERLALLFILVVAVAVAWATFHYANNITAVNESYLKAKTMITPLENDHIRFSWLVAVAVLLAGWLCWHRKRQKDLTFWTLIILIGGLIIFLHVLAARTGLFSFYIMLAGMGVWLIFSAKKRRYAITLLSLMILLPVAAYFLLPSFRNRVKYIRYDFSYFKEAKYLPGANDAMRLISINAGWNVMNEHPVTGTGFGDIGEGVKEEYAIRYPGMLETDKILPASEWIMYGSGCGWPGFLLFTVAMVVPFFIKKRIIPGWWLLNGTAAFGFLFDIGLEVQFGVFIYSFIIGLSWKWLVTEKI